MSKIKENPSKSITKITNLDEITLTNYRSICQDKVDGLVASILKVGVLEPVKLLRTTSPEQKLYMIAGHHRYHAILKIRNEYPHLGHFALPAIVEEGSSDDLNSKKFITEAVVSNEAREESKIIERARGYAILQNTGMSVREICDVVGKSRRVVEKCLQVDKLPNDVKQYVVENVATVKENLVYLLAARSERGEKVSIADFNRVTQKSSPKNSVEMISIKKSALTAILEKHKVASLKVEMILKEIC